MCRRILLAALVSQAAVAQAPVPTPPNLKPLEFLLGNWTGIAGDKDTPLGAGMGDYSFEAQLEGHIIVRRNQAKYDSGQSHDDLMVIYFEDSKAAPYAIYFDGEGHVIHYRASFPAAGVAVFESEAFAAGPRFRLTYAQAGAGLDGKFELAVPGQGFQSYMNWKSRRR